MSADIWILATEPSKRKPESYQELTMEGALAARLLRWLVLAWGATSRPPGDERRESMWDARVGALPAARRHLGAFLDLSGRKAADSLPKLTCVPMGLPSALGYKYIPEATPVFRLFVAVGGSASIGE